MMNPTDGWMRSWLGGTMGGWISRGIWIWTLIGVLSVVLLVVVTNKQSKKQSCVRDQPGETGSMRPSSGFSTTSDE